MARSLRRHHLTIPVARRDSRPSRHLCVARVARMGRSVRQGRGASSPLGGPEGQARGLAVREWYTHGSLPRPSGRIQGLLASIGKWGGLQGNSTVNGEEQQRLP